MLFDSLKELHKEDQYEKYLGRMRAVRAAVFVFAAALGGIIGELYGLTAAFWLTLPSMAAATLIPFALKEPHFHRSTGEVKHWQHVKMTGTFLLRRPRFIHFAVLITAVMVPMTIFDEYAQIYYAFLGVGAIGLGLLGSFGSALDVVFNMVVMWFKRFEHNRLFGVMLTIFSAGLMSAYLFKSWVGVLLLVVSTTGFYVIEVIAMADINRQLPSKIRATSESFFSLASRIVHIPAALTFGFVSQKYSPAVSFGFLGTVLAIYAFYYWLVTIMRGRTQD